jgi:hypothetical protein
MWYFVQGIVFFGIVWLLQSLGIPRQAPLWIVGAAGALWVTTVYNSVVRARELRREGRGWLRKWAIEVWKAEQFLPR